MVSIWAKLKRRFFAKTAEADTPHPLVFQVLQNVHRALAHANVPHAIIGGLALGALGAPRMTKDVDLLIAEEDRERAATALTSLGFETLATNETFSSFNFDLSVRVDLLHARRERTRAMLRDATSVPYRGLDIAVVRPEDLIGLKLQAIKNRPERPYDRGDIERVITHYGERLDVERIRDYCDHLGLAHELEWIKARIAAAAR